MPPPLHEAFSKHCEWFERIKAKQNVRRWKCFYCGKTLTSSSFRLLVHLTHEGKGASYCKGIAAEAHAEVRKKFFPLKTRKGSATARASEEIVEPDIEEDDVSEEEEESPSVAIATGGASSGGASSKKSKALISPQHVVQVITDNASNCKKMGRKLEAEYPGIFWTPCASYCIDLLMEDIGGLPWVKTILSDALHSLLNDGQSEGACHSLLLLRFGVKEASTTQFAAMWLLFERLYDVRNKLKQTVVSDEFKEWMEEEPTGSQEDAKAVQCLCLGEEFWDKVKGLVVVILPLYKALRMTDMEGATIGLLYHFMEEA
ncbi:hypothetical protein L7F22_064799 [Adiantum nelumboides]|nr:hypothetical protein [Adiantum nelumboides]